MPKPAIIRTFRFARRPDAQRTLLTGILAAVVGLAIFGLPPDSTARPADWNGTYGPTDESCPGSDLAVRYPTLTYDDCRDASLILLEDRPHILTLMIDDDAACAKRGWVLQLTGKPAADLLVRGYRDLDAINHNSPEFECRYRPLK